MRAKFTLSTDGRETDLAVDHDGDVTVGDLIDELARQNLAENGLYLSVRDRLVLADRASLLVQAGLRNGDVVEVRRSPERRLGPALGVVEITEPDGATRFEPLPRGETTVGRLDTADIQVGDERSAGSERIGRKHLMVRIDERTVTVQDLDSANGTEVNGEQLAAGAPRAVGPTDEVVVAEHTALKIRRDTTRAGAVPHTVQRTTVDQPPRPYEGKRFELPAPPQAAAFDRVSAGIGVGSLATAALTLLLGQGNTLVPIAVAAVGGLTVAWRFYQKRFAKKRQDSKVEAEWKDRVESVLGELEAERETERTARRAETPSTRELASAARQLSPVLWRNAPGEQGFLRVRLGLGDLHAASQADVPSVVHGSADQKKWMESVVAERATISEVPVTVDLESERSLGIAMIPRPGEVTTTVAPEAVGLARAVVAQIAALHPPHDVEIHALLASSAASDWEWLKWLPHAPAGAFATGVDALTVGPERNREHLNMLRSSAAEANGAADGGPRTVIVVDVRNEMSADEVREMRTGLDPNAVVVLVARALNELPRWCTSRVGISPETTAPDERGNAEGTFASATIEAPLPFTLEVAGAEGCTQMARSLAALREGTQAARRRSLPSLVTLSEVLETPERLFEPNALIRQWNLNREPRANVGLSEDGPLEIDLRSPPHGLGFHGLIAGSTGSGKSELLRSLVASLALSVSPQHLNFLLVDFKGGATFLPCAGLPHTVGLVTDLELGTDTTAASGSTGDLITRMLVSLDAEIRYRKALFNEAGAKDLNEMVASKDERTPARLLVVIDEFADLVDNVEGVQDSIVSIARQGRSLGIHLILAMQSPYGIVNAQTERNAELRIAMRVLSEDDSRQILGVPDALHLPDGAQGRGLIKTAAGVSTFQSTYLDARTEGAPTGQALDVAELRLGYSAPDSATADTSEAPTDLQRVVTITRAASLQAGLPSPRRPWLPPLPSRLTLEEVTAPGSAAGVLTVGRADEPSEQRQRPAQLDLSRTGHLLVCGGQASGKTTLLETIAVAAGHNDAERIDVYGLDFGSRSLAAIDVLPQVGDVVHKDDAERVERLIATMRQAVDDRSNVFASTGAGSLVELREMSPDEWPRLLLLIDGLPEMIEEYETIDQGKLINQLEDIVSTGARFGVHVVATSDRFRGLKSRFRELMPHRAVYPMGSTDDQGDAGVKSGLSSQSPAGRCFMVSDTAAVETQVALLAHYDDGSSRRDALTAEAAKQASGDRVVPPKIKRLSERVALTELAHGASLGEIVVGLGDDLAPASFSLERGGALILGRPESGKTWAATTFALAVRTSAPDLDVYFVGQPPEGLLSGSAVTLEASEATELIEGMAETTAEDLGPITAVVVVDDFDRHFDTDLDRRVGEALKRGDSSIRFVIAADTAAARSSFSDTLRTLRNQRTGLILDPEPMDGDLLGADLPRRMPKAKPGRGFLVNRGRLILCQVAMPV